MLPRPKNIWTQGRKQLISWHVLESTPLVPANQTINKRPFSCNLSKENVIGSHRLRPFKEMFLVVNLSSRNAEDLPLINIGSYDLFHSTSLTVTISIFTLPFCKSRCLCPLSDMSNYCFCQVPVFHSVFDRRQRELWIYCKGRGWIPQDTATPETQILPLILIKNDQKWSYQIDNKNHFEVAPESHGNSATGHHRRLISALLDTLNTKAWIHMRGSGSVVALTYCIHNPVSSCVLSLPGLSSPWRPRRAAAEQRWEWLLPFFLCQSGVEDPARICKRN